MGQRDKDQFVVKKFIFMNLIFVNLPRCHMTRYPLNVRVAQVSDESWASC